MRDFTEDKGGNGMQVVEYNTVARSGNVSRANAFKSVASAVPPRRLETLFDNHLRLAASTVATADVRESVSESSKPAIIVRACIQCGKTFSPHRQHLTAKNRGLFCSKGCRDLAQRGKRLKVNDMFRTPDSTKAERVRANGLIGMRIRRGLIERPKKCQRCGKAGRVDAHHPDYQLSPELCAFLCRSCHMRCHHHPEIEREVAAMARMLTLSPIPSPAAGDGAGARGAGR